MEGAGTGSGAAAAEQSDAGAPRKSTFDSLDKPELINKCKGLLQLAKSAKQTKDEYAAENTRLKTALSAVQQQRVDDKANLQHLQASLRKLNDTVDTLEQQKLLDKDYMKGMQEMVDELTNEKDTLGRRVQRLTLDNDRLLSDCRQSDAILRQLNDSMATHQQQVQQLQLMCEQQKAANGELRQQLQSADGQQQLVATLRDRCHSHEAKLKLYRTKLGTFAGQLKQMRVCKEVLRTTVTEYSQSVIQWQGDILNVSNDFVQRNRRLADENSQLQAKLAACVADCERRCGEMQQQQPQQQFESDAALRSQLHDQSLEIAELSGQLARLTCAADAVQPDRQACRSQLLQLDETLGVMAAEAERLQRNHQQERQLLEQRCVEAEETVGQRDRCLETQRERLRRADEQSAKLLLERDSLIEKGQHLIEMVQELQQNVQQSSGGAVQELEELRLEHARAIGVLQVEIEALRAQFDASRLDAERTVAAERAKYETCVGEQNRIQGELLASQEVHRVELETLIGERDAATQQNAQLPALEADVTALQAQLAERAKEIIAKGEEIKALQNDVAQRVADLNRIDGEMGALRGQSERLSAFELEVATLQAQLAERANELAAKSEEESKRLQEARSIFDAEQKVKDGEIVSLRSAVADRQIDVDRLIEAAKQDQNTYQAKLAKLQSSKDEIDALEFKLVDDTKRLQEAAKHDQLALNAKSIEFDELHAKFIDQNANLVKLRAEIETLISKLQTQTEATNQQQETLKHNQQALEVKSIEFDQLHDKFIYQNTILVDLRAEIDSLNSKLQTQMDDISVQSQAEVAALKATLAESSNLDQQALSAKSIEVDELNAKFIIQNANLAELRTEIETLNSQLQTQMEKISKMTEVSHQQQETSKHDQQALAEKSIEFEDLQNKFIEQNNNLVELQAEIKTLNTKLQTQMDDIRIQSQDEMSALKAAFAESAKLDQQALSIKSIEFDELHAKFTDQNSNLAELRTEIETLNSKLQTQLEEINALSETTNQQQETAEHYQQALADKSIEFDQVQAKFIDQNTTLVELQATIESLRSELANRTEANAQQLQTVSVLESTSERVASLQLELAATQQKLTDSDSLIADLHERLATAASQYEHIVQQHDEHRQTAASQLDAVRAQYDQQVAELAARLADAGAQLAAVRQAAEQTGADRDNQLQSKTREMDDLLAEMRELNEALRNRGDVISKQEQRIAALVAEVGDRSATGERLLVERTALLEKLQEAQEQAARANPADISYDQLSTSTISRVEEVARMRDIEDSFEEKYNKLRQLAVKLKRKCTEQAQRIDELTTSAERPTTTTADAASNAMQTATVAHAVAAAAGGDPQHARNLQHMQREHDKLLDELDAARADRRELSARADQLGAELAEVRAELGATRSSLEDVRCSADAGQTQRAGLDLAVREYVKQIQQLKEEVTAAKQTQQAAVEEATKLKVQVQSRDGDCEKQAAELKRLKSSLKKTNVLSLEIEAQEKSLIDISQKLDARTLQVDELKSNIQQLEATIDELKKQLCSTGEELQSEREHSTELKAQIEHQHSKYKLAEAQRSELQLRLDEAQHQRANADEELAELRSSNAQSAGDLERNIATLLSDNQQLLGRLATTEEQAGDAQSMLRATAQELDALRTEFVAYKVRAQSQLRHNQQKETSREAELDDELTASRASVAQLTAKLAAAQQHAQQLDAAAAEHRTEAGRLQAHAKQLMHIADEARQNADALQEDLRRQAAEHQATVRAVRLQSETLSTCYKTEMVELRAAHELQLQQQNQKLMQQQHHQQQLPHQHQQQKTQSSDTAGFGGEPLATQLSDDVAQQRIDWILSERQSGEGSESNVSQSQQQQRRISTVSTGGGRHPRDLIPLDELLNGNAFDAATATGEEEEELAASGADMEATRQRLNMQQSRVKHLTTLLAESEQDTARLTQLNDALKEELRRQERSAEREQHLHNLEYLKNVMFKFLTISQGDEKAHLVPVLNTMLKLSPDETQKLQAVAKGTDASQRGWGRYLPI